MKILRIFGVVVGIHLVALLLIFADPGCSVGRTQTAQADPTQPSAPQAVPPITPAPADTASAITFNGGSAAPGGAAYAPTRPGTPAATALVAQPVADVVPAATYVVSSGDSLWSIAKKNHLKVSDLAKANSLRTGSVIQPGQKLIIPQRSLGSDASAGAAADSAQAKPRPSAGGADASGHYTVKHGESLRSIAHKFHVKMSDIAAANSISDPKSIQPGQDLIIPGGHAPSAAAPAPQPAPEAAPAAPQAAPSPAPNQDLDAGLKPSPSGDIPVVKVDDSTGAQK
jgi:LysM repeat protein